MTETQDLVPLVDAAVLNDVPAELLLRRPDVRAAEWQVASQSALVGVAVTDLYPAVTLLGSIGWTASSLDGASDALEIGGGPSLRWNVFDTGGSETTCASRTRACSSSSKRTGTGCGRQRARRTMLPRT